MRKASSVVGVAAALTTIALMGSPAWGAACLATTFTPSGNPINFNVQGGGTATSCSVDGVTFSNVIITQNTGSIGAPTLIPTTLGNESGFQLNSGAAGPADFTWSLTAAGNLLGDAFASLTDANATLLENIMSNGNPTPPGTIATISLSGTSSQTVNFTPQMQVVAVKDQMTFAGGQASSLIDAFSLVPAPIVGAGLPGLIAACGGLLGLARRRRRQQVA